MNIVEKVREILTNCELMDLFNQGHHIDYTDKSLVNNYGLYTSGETITKRFIYGDVEKVHRFYIYSVLDNTNDADRLTNAGFLIRLGDYLNALEIEPFTNDDKIIHIISFEPANAMLYDTAEDKKAIYQFQLGVRYKEESKED